MECAKGTAVAGLYDDLMVEILSRVPVKDVRRSKCVSKPWRDLIANPLHRKKLHQTLEGFFHGGAGALHRKKLHQTLEGFFHGGAGGRRSYGHFTSLLGSRERVPPVDPSFSFLTAKLPGVKRMVLLDSCNGLVLFGCTREDKFMYIVCNPVTVPASSGTCPPLPPLEESYGDTGRGRYAHTFLMFDPAVSLHFSLVQIWENRLMEEVETVCAYSSVTRAWIDRSSKWKQVKRAVIGDFGVKHDQIHVRRGLINGLLHFIVYHLQKEEALIIAVDGEGKTCRIMSWHDKHESAEASYIDQSQGHLDCISVNLQLQGFHIYCTQVSVWVLEDYDTHEWILKHNVNPSHVFGLLRCPIHDFVLWPFIQITIR